MVERPNLSASPDQRGSKELVVEELLGLLASLMVDDPDGADKPQPERIESGFGAMVRICILKGVCVK